MDQNTNSTQSQGSDDTIDWGRWIELSAKSLLILWNLILLVGGAVVFIYCVLVAGHVPSVKLDNIISTLFSVSLVGIFLMAALIATFIGPAFLWRMADQASEYRKGKAGAGSGLPSLIGKQAHAVPAVEVSTEHKNQNFFQAFTWEFLIAHVLIDVSFLLSMALDLSSELAAYFFFGASALPLLYRKRASTFRLWWANIWRCFDELWLRLLAMMSSIAPVFIVLLLLQLETNASFIVVGLMLQVLYALLYIPILAKPKDNRRQDLTFWATGIILPTILLLVFTGQKLTASVLLQTGLGNLTEVVLYVDSEGRAILAKHGFMDSSVELRDKESIHAVQGLDVVLAMGGEYVLKRHDPLHAIKRCRFMLPKSGRESDDRSIDCLILPAAHVRAIGSVGAAGPPADKA